MRRSVLLLRDDAIPGGYRRSFQTKGRHAHVDRPRLPGLAITIDQGANGLPPTWWNQRPIQIRSSRGFFTMRAAASDESAWRSPMARGDRGPPEGHPRAPDWHVALTGSWTTLRT